MHLGSSDELSLVAVDAKQTFGITPRSDACQGMGNAALAGDTGEQGGSDGRREIGGGEERSAEVSRELEEPNDRLA